MLTELLLRELDTSTAPDQDVDDSTNPIPIIDPVTNPIPIIGTPRPAENLWSDGAGATETVDRYTLQAAVLAVFAGLVMLAALLLAVGAL